MATAAVLIAVLLAALFLLPRGGVAGFLAAVLAAAAWEWARLCRLGGLATGAYAAGVAAVFGAAVLLEAGTHPAWFAAAVLFWLAVAPVWLWRGVRPGHRAALAFAGFVVLVPAALALLALGPGLALLVLALVWVADITAYFVGMRIGRHKLAPAVSPGKT